MPVDIRLPVAEDAGIFALRAAGIIVRPDSAEFLMVTNDTDDYWYTVGGAVEFGETAREALVREIREELGEELAIGELAAVEESFFGAGELRTGSRRAQTDWHQVTFSYWVDVPDGFDPVARSAASHGAVERLGWLGVDDLAAGAVVFPRFLPDVLAGRWQGVRHLVERGGRYV